MNEYFYDFAVDGHNRGFSYLYLDSEKLQSVTRFLLEDGSMFTNVFLLRLKDKNVLACRHGDFDWVDLSELPSGHYPSCAYPLLLSKARSKPFNYVQVSERDGSPISETVLDCHQQVITEYQGGKVCRSFTMDGDIPVSIDWGAAKSKLHPSAEASTEGSGIIFSIEGLRST